MYYRTAYNQHIRCISLDDIDFGKVAYQWHPMDAVREEPIEPVRIS